MENKSLNEYSKEELIKIINSLKKQKKFGLVWEDKPEKVAIECEQKLPVLKEVEEKTINGANSSAPTNIIIEGDNYHALSVLNYTHAGKIDVIYIDPPYNTGNKDFIYNDRFIDKEDSFRHSKWLSFMAKRLSLAKNLLSPKGVIFISIDDNEQANLQLLCNSIFGEDCRVANMIWRRKTGASDANGLATITEHILVYTRNSDKSTWSTFFRGNSDSYDRNRYRLSDEYKNERGNYYTDSLDRGGLRYSDSLNYPIECPDGTKTYPNGRLSFANDGWTWKWGQEKVKWGIENGFIVFKKSKNKPSGWTVQYKNYMFVDNNCNHIERAAPFKNLILDILNTDGAMEQKAIFGKKVFNNPKPVKLVKFLTYLVKENNIVLDFFAGSGTTGQAVMELNQEDGGNRQFILCTNNENQIAEEVTYPRIKTVVTGTRPDGTKYSDGIPANVRYFKTDFVEKDDTLDKLRRKLSPACEDMIRIREGAYEKLIDDDMLKVYKNSHGLTAIVYDRFELEEHLAKIEELETDSPVNLYVFSYTKHDRLDEIDKPLKHTYISQPIPEGVLEIYKRIFNQKGGNR